MLLSVTTIFSSLGFVILGAFLGFILSNVIGEKGLLKAKQQAQQLIEDAKKDAEKHKKEVLLETKQEIHQLQQTFDKQIKERKREVDVFENKLFQREQMLDRRSSNLDKREANLDLKEQNLERRKQSLDDKTTRLEKIVVTLNNMFSSPFLWYFLGLPVYIRFVSIE